MKQMQLLIIWNQLQIQYHGSIDFEQLIQFLEQTYQFDQTQQTITYQQNGIIMSIDTQIEFNKVMTIFQQNKLIIFEIIDKAFLQQYENKKQLIKFNKFSLNSKEKDKQQCLIVNQTSVKSIQKQKNYQQYKKQIQQIQKQSKISNSIENLIYHSNIYKGSKIQQQEFQQIEEQKFQLVQIKPIYTQKSLDFITCFNQRKGQNICMTENCKSLNYILCSQKLCICQNQHNQCLLKTIQEVKKTISKKFQLDQKISVKIQSIISEINSKFDIMINRLIKQKENIQSYINKKIKYFYFSKQQVQNYQLFILQKLQNLQYLNKNKLINLLQLPSQNVLNQKQVQNALEEYLQKIRDYEQKSQKHSEETIKQINKITLKQNQIEQQYQQQLVKYDTIYVNKLIDKKQLDQAFKLANQAVIKQNTIAYADLARVYYEKNRIPRNKQINQLTLQLSQKGTKYDHSNAYNMLGICNIHGLGVQKNKNLGLSFLKFSAYLGNVYAQASLGWYNLKDSNSLQKAIKWLIKSADQGCCFAQNDLAYCYMAGSAGELNYEEAFYYYSKSAQQQNPQGQYFLGYCYQNGFGTQINMQKAFQLYLKSAKKNYKDAIQRLKLFKK